MLAWLADFLNELVLGYGYLGVFLAAFLSCLTIFVVFPAHFIVFALGAKLNPFLIGLLAGAGAALGETSAYLLSYFGSKAAQRKKSYRDYVKKYGKLLAHYGSFLLLILFAATPLPDDAVGLLCGALQYDYKKFLLANFIGKTILFIIIALTGNLLINRLVPW
jgi:membrane protein YqaA with SNARE-associated domain